MKRMTKLCIKGKKGQQLNVREARLINNATVEGLLMFDTEEKHGKIILNYNTEGLVPIADFLKAELMTKKIFLMLMRGIVVSLRTVEINHFSKNLIEWSLMSSYIEPKTFCVYLMYIPLQPYETEGNLKDFLLDFISACCFDASDCMDYISKLSTEIKNSVSYTACLLNNFCEQYSADYAYPVKSDLKVTCCPACNSRLEDGEAVCPFCGSVIDVKGSHIGTEESIYESIKEKNGSTLSVNRNKNGIISVFSKPHERDITVWLETRGNQTKIIISKFPFRIGSVETEADYRLNSNKISGKHADIIRENGKYFIVDLGKANGTYLNDRRIQPGVMEELIDGAHFKIADIEFKFHID